MNGGAKAPSPRAAWAMPVGTDTTRRVGHSHPKPVFAIAIDILCFYITPTLATTSPYIIYIYIHSHLITFNTLFHTDPRIQI